MHEIITSHINMVTRGQRLILNLIGVLKGYHCQRLQSYFCTAQADHDLTAHSYFMDLHHTL